MVMVEEAVWVRLPFVPLSVWHSVLIEVFVVYLVMPFSGYFKIQDAAQIIWNPFIGS